MNIGSSGMSAEKGLADIRRRYKDRKLGRLEEYIMVNVQSMLGRSKLLVANFVQSLVGKRN